jgi:tRNA(Ile)-lysidine synthase
LITLPITIGRVIKLRYTMLNQNQNRKYIKQDLSILYTVNNLITEKNLLQPNKRILLAISGGQDSICILKILFLLQSKWDWQIGIIHCDHRWNSISQLQANYVSQLAHSMELDYYQAITVNNINSEVSARNWRYHLIKQIAHYHQYRTIVTAHTASDRIETFMYNLIRGCGVTGLQALSWKRRLSQKVCIHTFSLYKRNVRIFHISYKENNDKVENKKDIKHVSIVRPLLSVTRVQIRLLLINWKFPVWSDPTNRLIKIYRNRIRHRLIPYMRLYFHPKIDQTLSQWTELVHYETIFLDKLTEHIRFKIEIPILNQKDNSTYIALPIEILCSLPIFLQQRIIKQFIEKNTQVKIIFHQIEHIRLKCSYQKILSKRGIAYNAIGHIDSIPIEYVNICLPKQTKVKLTNHFILIQKIA